MLVQIGHSFSEGGKKREQRGGSQAPSKVYVSVVMKCFFQAGRTDSLRPFSFIKSTKIFTFCYRGRWKKGALLKQEFVSSGFGTAFTGRIFFRWLVVLVGFFLFCFWFCDFFLVGFRSYASFILLPYCFTVRVLIYLFVWGFLFFFVI